MSLGTMLHEQLKELHTGNTAVPVHADTHHALLNVVDIDRYSVAMADLAVWGAFGHGDDMAMALDVAAAALVHELNYLEEPLAIIEREADEGRAVLRSAQPQREGDALSYWEIGLETAAETKATIARYAWAPGMAERERVAYPATFRLIARITDSIEQALGRL